jgi:hypothetical protein
VGRRISFIYIARRESYLVAGPGFRQAWLSWLPRVDDAMAGLNAFLEASNVHLYPTTSSSLLKT